MHWFSGGTNNIFLCLVLCKQRTDYLDYKVEFLALAMTPGLMAIALIDVPLFIDPLIGL